MRKVSLIAVVAAIAVAAAVGAALAWDAGRPADDEIVIDVAATAEPPIPATQDASVVWTGREFLVWGGGTGNKVNGGVRAEGAAYDPARDTWRTLPPAPLEARERHAAVWTGEEMLVWGGTPRHHGVGDLLDGARYDPATDSWAPIAPAPHGTDRSEGQAVAIGDRVVIGGGYGPTAKEETVVLIYDLGEDRWDTHQASGQVRQILAVGDDVALLTERHQPVDGGRTELRVEVLDPARTEGFVAGRLDLDQSFLRAGLLAHDGELTVLVQQGEEDTRLYQAQVDEGSRHLDLVGEAPLSPPTRLDPMQPHPVLADGSRRIIMSDVPGPLSGLDLQTGALARAKGTSAAARCLANASHGVGGGKVLVWGGTGCGPDGEASDAALLTATWIERGD